MQDYRCDNCKKVIAKGEGEILPGFIAIIKAARIGIKCRHCDTITYLGYSGNMVEKFFEE